MKDHGFKILTVKETGSLSGVGSRLFGDFLHLICSIDLCFVTWAGCHSSPQDTCSYREPTHHGGRGMNVEENPSPPDGGLFPL